MHVHFITSPMQERVFLNALLCGVLGVPGVVVNATWCLQLLKALSTCQVQQHKQNWEQLMAKNRHTCEMNELLVMCSHRIPPLILRIISKDLGTC